MKDGYKLTIFLSVIVIILAIFIHGTVIHLTQVGEFQKCVNATLSDPLYSTFACDRPGWWFGI
ncbi:MAG: hypothetical protein WCX79_00530 [Candidatus Paceibacterota bacterium]|jgi:hypothetical protein